ncbi:complement C1q-like protein 4 [Chanodichthys erythropterus]|uniref:complement C1q-like protein 4 n=1 Tax=Chanodichthys erythropterus TaxID=933992 RepID=UPI00351DCE99
MKALVCILLLLETFVFVVQQQVDGGLNEKEIPDIYKALRELTATVKELRDEMKKKDDEISNLTLSQVELRKENRDREIAFSASMGDSGSGYVESIGPFPTETTIIYKNVITNIGNAYNPITGIFTAPLKGAYMFRITIHGHGPTSSGASIFKNGQRVVSVYDSRQSPGYLQSSNGVVLILEVGDVVCVKLRPAAKTYDSNYNRNTFSGYLLFPLK